MTGKQHLAFGIVTGASVGLALTVNTDMTVLQGIGFSVLSGFGSLIPDIDTKESIIGRTFPLLSRFISNAFGHRTYTHSFVLCLLLSVISYIFLPHWVCGIMFGYLGHLFLDSLTVKGIPFICVFSKKKQKKPTIHLLPSFMRCKGDSFWSNVLIIFNTFICIGFSLYSILYPAFA